MRDIRVYKDKGHRVIAKRYRSSYSELHRNWPAFAKEVCAQGFHPCDWGIEEYIGGNIWNCEDFEYDLMLPVENDIEPKRPLFMKSLDAVKVISIVFRGSFDMLLEAFEELRDFANNKGFAVNGNLRVYHLRCPKNTDDSEGYVTELQLPIE